MDNEELTKCAIDSKICLANHETRITNLEETVKDIKDLTQVTSELAYCYKDLTAKYGDLNETVKTLAEAPQKKWVVLRTAIISSIGGSIGTGIIAGIVALILLVKGAL